MINSSAKITPTPFSSSEDEDKKKRACVAVKIWFRFLSLWTNHPLLIKSKQKHTHIYYNEQ